MTDLTLLFVLGPPLIITLFLLIFKRSMIYGRICTTLILVLWAITFIDLLNSFLGTVQNSVWNGWTGSSQGVDEGVLLAQFALDVFRSGAMILEQLLFWGFVAFFAVIIGSIYLFITCLTKRGGSLKGKSLSEKMSSVSFSKTIENPLVSKLDVNGLQSYLLIGLITMPSMISISIAMNLAGLSIFSINAIYYVLLFYRFSLLGYTRIARKAELKLAGDDIGHKYEKRMLSWFTKLNLFVSVALLTITLVLANPPLSYITEATIAETQSLLAAIIILPFVEGFAVLFFKRFWGFWTRLRTRIRGINLKNAGYSLIRGIFVGGACFVLFYSMLAFMSATVTFFSLGSPSPTFNVELGMLPLYQLVKSILDQLTQVLNITSYSPTLPGYSSLALPALWMLVSLFLFQLIKVLLGGSLTHRKKVAPEYAIIVASITIAVLIWVLVPATNFILDAIRVNLATSSGLSTQGLLFLAQPLQEEFFTVYYVVPAPSVLLYMFLLDFPIWIFGSLLLTYFFIFRRQLIPAKKEADVLVSSDFFKLFISFCVVAVASIGTIFLMDPTSALGSFVHGLLSKLWFPNANTVYFFSLLGPSYVFFHNMIRFLLTVFAPLLFWASIIGIRKAWNGESVKNLQWYILAMILLVLEAIVFFDRFTWIAIIGIPLVLAALYRWFYRIVKRDKPKTMFRTTLLKISFYSLILSEIYSTALAIADRYMFLTPSPPAPQLTYFAGGNLGLLIFLLELVPHGLVEIPAAMFAGMIGLYVARRMTSKLDENEKNLDKFMDEGVNLFWSRKVWYPILLVTIFFAIAAVIEVLVAWNIMGPLANSFGFA
jgi:hypothetical protein